MSMESNTGLAKRGTGVRLFSREVTDQIAATARDQHGVVGRQQLADLGLTQRQIAGAVNAGVLRKVGPRAYSALTQHTSRRGRMWGAQLSLQSAPRTGSPGFGLGFATAAEAFGWKTAPNTTIHLVMDRRLLRSGPGIRAHLTTHLPAADLVLRDGLWLTSPARTLLDLAAVVTPDHLDQLIDRSIQLRDFDLRELGRVRKERRTHGNAALRAALDRLHETAGQNRSELERRMIKLITESYLPPVACNARLHGFEVDIHFPGTRAIVETDGAGFHLSPAQIADDIEKQTALEAHGFVIKRLNWNQVNYEPEATVANVDRFRMENLAPPVPRR